MVTFLPKRCFHVYKPIPFAGSLLPKFVSTHEWAKSSYANNSAAIRKTVSVQRYGAGIAYPWHKSALLLIGGKCTVLDRGDSNRRPLNVNESENVVGAELLSSVTEDELANLPFEEIIKYLSAPKTLSTDSRDITGLTPEQIVRMMPEERFALVPALIRQCDEIPRRVLHVTEYIRSGDPAKLASEVQIQKIVELLAMVAPLVEILNVRISPTSDMRDDIFNLVASSLAVRMGFSMLGMLEMATRDYGKPSQLLRHLGGIRRGSTNVVLVHGQEFVVPPMVQEFWISMMKILEPENIESSTWDGNTLRIKGYGMSEAGKKLLMANALDAGINADSIDLFDMMPEISSWLGWHGASVELDLKTALRTVTIDVGSQTRHRGGPL